MYGVVLSSKSAVAFKYRSFPTNSAITRTPTVWHHCWRFRPAINRQRCVAPS